MPVFGLLRHYSRKPRISASDLLPPESPSDRMASIARMDGTCLAEHWGVAIRFLALGSGRRRFVHKRPTIFVLVESARKLRANLELIQLSRRPQRQGRMIASGGVFSMIGTTRRKSPGEHGAVSFHAKREATWPALVTSIFPGNRCDGPPARGMLPR